MTKTPEKIFLDFSGTDKEASGPINWAIDEMEGKYFRKWLAPVLRSLAETPERAAEIDCNEGVLDIIDVKFPKKGSLISPNHGKPTGMRFFLMLRSLGIFAACLSKATNGKMPADHETIRIWGLTGGKTQNDFYLFREVLGGGGPGRPWADGSDVVHIVPNSRNLPAEFSETKYPIFVEKLGLEVDSGGCGFRRGGLGYDKRIRSLQDCRLISNADRSVLNCYGVNGGMASKSYKISVQDNKDKEKVYPGMCDSVFVKKNELVKIVTTGGGGWGNPLKREPEKVIYDLQCGLISEASAKNDYGVCFFLKNGEWQLNLEETIKLRSKLTKSIGKIKMFNRGKDFKKIESLYNVVRPKSWSNNDENWYANEKEI